MKIGIINRQNLFKNTVPIAKPRLTYLSVCCIAEEVESEKLAFVILVFAEDARLGDFSALNQLGQANQLAKLGSEVESVAFVGHKIYVAFAGIKHGEEFCYINVV